MKKLLALTVGVLLIALAVFDGKSNENLESEREKLLATDKHWSELDLEEQLTFLAEDAIYLGEGVPLVSGKEAITQAWRQEEQLPGFSLTWQPDSAEISTSGELGYTFGSNEVNLINATGVRTTTKGKYVTIWRKQSDGSWKVVVDITNSDGPAVPFDSPDS
jgi:ketosteroid isomerase-like protein